MQASNTHFFETNGFDQGLDKWTKQEIGFLLRHLKENGESFKYRRIQLSDIRPQGMTSFVQKYVLERKIPIPKLLLAFGVNLVRFSYV